ncbi:ATP F0F1 synthase subunit B' [Thioclava sediminum]|jgi:F-type H+-transporting ATPase subunit b|uniref:ATP synthase subunit b n=2 Tax=Thioclava TaxID=285107 RepID=A0ABX6YX97_9RHOB|nr:MULTISPECIES: F0F1 ATP synthase subunit B' [Thioclava]MAQ38231.1 ATP F0F1 synthase subunit B' [Thioclava sp.]MPQ92764.1 F0F1 ATP synthase subunit B' [Thioclava sp. JE_KL1]OOY03761.1 ATP F0F1 synthase subunit B' [Thioclava sp. F28-4]OOY16956.1 ATP F0F1 synthase subunit B' [Thioclava sp. DLFJ4-1]OOY19320.1 ATP F0F1 synthase subunit B' [Thioclava sp. DLFJ5-1]
MASETQNTAHAAADAAQGAAHTAQKAGMPQLDFSSYPNQIFWLVVALVAIYWLLTRIALPRIEAVLADRQGTIAGDIAAAEDFKRKAEEAEAAYEKALAEARAQAQKIAGETKAEIQKDLDAAIAKADAEIAARSAESEARIAEIRDGALAAVDQVAKDTAGEIVAALGGNSDASAVNAAVEQRLKG